MYSQRRLALAFLLVLLPTQSLRAQTEAVVLARDGKALLPVVVAKDAGPRLRKAAETLAEYLGKIAETSFSVQEGDGRHGIAVGLPGQFPTLKLQAKWQGPKITQREDYLLRSHPRGVYVLGATELAVEHAVWDLLYRLGYRQFFPGKTWEVVPSRRTLTVAVDAEETPDFYSRRIWYGFGPWDYAAEPYADWCAKNRATSGLVLQTGHSYSGIIRANQEAFDAHPEYFSLLKGKRHTSSLGQLCLSNPDLRQLVIRHALKYFAAHPEADSMSLDPNDGGGWCECEECARMGSVSDRVLTLANEVAAAVNARYPGKYIGIYAYASHSPPPHIRVHPQVVVSVATAFIRGGYTLDELIAGWSKQGATLGIREYYSVHTWDRDLPGKARGCNLAYLQKTIPSFHARGARFLSAESSDNWGCNGLGYYLAARLLWNVDESKNSETIVEDFLTRAFGAAKEPMREFYQQIDGSRPHLLPQDQLARMYRALAKAKQRTDAPEILARIDDLLLYTRYVDLFTAYAGAKGKERQTAFEEMIRHGYRMRKTMMIHTKALYRDVVSRDKSVSIPADARWNVAEAKNPWKSSQPFRQTELTHYLKDGIQKHPLAKMDFTPVEFSTQLVPARPLQLAAGGGTGGLRGRGTQTFFTYVKTAPADIELRITGGLIAHYRDRGNVRVEVWSVGDDEVKTAEDRSVPPDGKERTIHLPIAKPGLYRITVADGGDMTQVDWPANQPLTLCSSLAEPLRTTGRWSLYFYVPRGTRVLGLFGGQHGDIIDPQGKTAFSLNKRPDGYYHVPVAEGQDGRLWQIRHASGTIRLLTVPPYLARSGTELLLPEEVVNRDSGARNSPER